MKLAVVAVVVLVVAAAWWVWRRSSREGMANPQVSDAMLAQFSEVTGQPITRQMLQQALTESKMTAEKLLEDLKKAPPPGVALGTDPAPTMGTFLECKKTMAPAVDGKCPPNTVLLPAQNGGMCASKACAEAYADTMAYYNGDTNLLAQHLLGACREFKQPPGGGPKTP